MRRITEPEHLSERTDTPGRWTPLSVCGGPTPTVFTVCSAQLEQVGALSAAVQPIEHVEQTAEAGEREIPE